jgi:hypothetical protein
LGGLRSILEAIKDFLEETTHMKKTWEWDEDDLLTLVNTKAQENIELDFKASDSLQNTDGKKRELSKDVSAFANSAGGTLVYGIEEDKSTHTAAKLDTGSDPTSISKEWIEQIINSNIHQRIDGIRIHQIELTTTSPGRVAYVIYIPQSTRTPHQAADNKFYKRFNFQSVPMEEYEVRDLYRRGEIPDLHIKFWLPQNQLVVNENNSISEPFELGAGISNNAFEPANHAIIFLFIDARLKIENTNGFSINDQAFTAIMGNKSFHVTRLQLNWNIPAKMPIFYSPYPFSITDNSKPFQLRIPIQEQPEIYLLGYQIGAPRMQMKEVYTLLYIESGHATLIDSNTIELAISAINANERVR